MANKIQVPSDVIFTIRRYDPDNDTAPHYEDYKVHVDPGLTVLDGLHLIRENQDPTLSWRYSCRMGVCGSCGMLVNGRAMLACNNQILDISKRRLLIAPLPNFDIIKDLVPDLGSMFEKHQSIHPFLIRESDKEEMENPTGEYNQSEEELVRYLQFSYCIRCGCCMAACPTLATDDKYLGPMPLAQGYRWNADTRDEGFDRRRPIAGDTHSAYRCHYAGECSNVCPKGVDPARAIQLLKKQLVKDYFHLMKKGPGCQSQSSRTGSERNPKIPDPPPFTVEQT
ncbi:MAG TPA: succinate dehydrogenase iron-sulfur subunit [Acidobacteriota bacterium]|nr:succinate dehydrogenase iron-sulfur subunit [Acidobacteriota bacterium]